MRPLLRAPPLLVLVLAACGGGPDAGAEARRLVEEEGATLLDVRTPGEFGAGHVEGARNVPISELAAAIPTIDPDRPVVVYCQSGGRSASAAATLRARGYRVHDLGPIAAWPGGD